MGSPFGIRDRTGVITWLITVLLPQPFEPFEEPLMSRYCQAFMPSSLCQTQIVSDHFDPRTEPLLKV